MLEIMYLGIVFERFLSIFAAFCQKFVAFLPEASMSTKQSRRHEVIKN